MLSFIICREESSKVFPLVKKVTVFVLALFASILVRAQTDDDIAIFLENVRNEVPKIEDLDFYMSAGRRLLNESRMEEANVFFDFAASLGNEDGFRGKAASSKDNSMKQYYTVFAERNNPNADRLINSLAAADEDISAAILVHDNIATFSSAYQKFYAYVKMYVTINYQRYSSSVVAPIHCMVPLAKAGFRILAASIEPGVEPAPIMVCISSMKMITS